jgi:hypothetical protein
VALIRALWPNSLLTAPIGLYWTQASSPLFHIVPSIYITPTLSHAVHFTSEDGGKILLRNFGNTAHFHMMEIRRGRYNVNFSANLRLSIPNLFYIQVVPGGKSIFWEVIVSAILSKKLYMYMCPIPNGF